jgi:hypothetical protein
MERKYRSNPDIRVNLEPREQRTSRNWRTKGKQAEPTGVTLRGIISVSKTELKKSAVINSANGEGAITVFIFNHGHA